MLNLLKHELFSRWKSVLGWGLALTFFGSMYTTIYPQVAEQIQGLADFPLYRILGIDLASFAGYIASVTVQYIPLLLGAFVIATSTGTLAGEEDAGTLELILATPLKRWQIVSMKALALVIITFLILLIVGAGVALALEVVKSTVDVEVNVTSGQLFIAMLNALPISIAFGMIGMFAGAYLPNRRHAVIFTATIFIGSYFAKAFFAMVEAFEPLRALSLFSYFDTTTAVFSEGVAVGDVAVLLTVAVIFFILTLLSFERRNVTVGLWPWQRAQIT